MDKNNLFLLFGGGFLLLALALPSIQLYRRILEKRRERKKLSLKKVVDAVLLPVNFGALFLENRQVEQLPAYYRYFLQFTVFTSRIPYFHFLPKGIIAFVAEELIVFFTGKDVLTAVIVCWSVLFLTIITIVEKQAGEMEERVITFANKLFLYTVSMLMLVLLIIYAFFWKHFEPILDIEFLHWVGKMADLSNEYMWKGCVYFWKSSWIFKFILVGTILIYTVSSYHLSKRLNKE